jgi:hypothetical protein
LSVAGEREDLGADAGPADGDGDGGAPRSPFRRRLGAALIALGLAGIAWGALDLADAAQGGRTRRTFAERVSYDQAKVRIHESLPGAFARGLTGFLLCVAGSWLRRT